jgi:endonuclease VIII
MPEGDTILQAAAKLERALARQQIVRFFSPLPKLKEAELVGREVTRVYARGKNIVIALDDGRALHTHLRMQGKWSVWEKSQLSPERLERLTRAPHSLNPVFTLSLETSRVIALCEQAAVAELASEREIERRLASLGPDLLASDFDAEKALENLRARPELPIGEAIMLQSMFAGVGNVFKSEILFLEKVSPFVSVGALDDQRLAAIVERARVLLNRNRTGQRRTQFSALTRMRFYVYERSGQHCIKCDATIQMRRQGSLMRSTYFCPDCQSVK